MVKRRKFLIGAGSLFAGGAAATGTGAFTEMRSGERSVKVRAADDSDGFVAIGPAGELEVEGVNTSPTPTNGIVKENDDGEVYIDITGRRTDKIGVNEGSTYWWDEALEIALWKASDGNTGYGGGLNHSFLVSIQENIPGVTFYTGTGENRSYGVSDIELDNQGNNSTPQSVLIGIRVKEDELPDQQRTFKGTPTQGTAQVVAERN
jgi:hypothetical protein